jgi:hypothetical protein
MCYRLRFAGVDEVETSGTIFQIDGDIFLCSGSISVRVPSAIYHQQMHSWIESRMNAPLIFTGGNGTKCVMRAPSRGGEVIVEVSVESARPQPISGV